MKKLLLVAVLLISGNVFANYLDPYLLSDNSSSVRQQQADQQQQQATQQALYDARNQAAHMSPNDYAYGYRR